MKKNFWLTVSIALLTVFIPLLHTPSSSGQVYLPADPELDAAIQGLMTTMYVGAPVLAPFMLPYMEGTLHFHQSLLYRYQLMVDDALLTAWTTQSLLDIDKSLHQAVASSNYIIQKLKNDVAWYEDRYSRFSIPTFRPETESEEERYNKYQTLKNFVKEHESPVKQAGKSVLDLFASVRTNINRGAYANPSMRLDSKKIAEALLAYHTVMSNVEKAIQEQIYKERVTPEKQIRMTLTNESPDLVFFIRVFERARDGSYPEVRPDTKYWLPIYPKGMSVELDLPDKKDQVFTLPHRIWIPVKLMDQLEIRVATMGETRKRIRFMTLSMTGQARPDLNALNRGFYFFGYEVMQSGGRSKIISHWYPVNESYSWYFKGGWGAEDPQFVETDVKELKEDIRYPLTLTRDHVSWRVPGFLESIKDYPDLSAEVSGTAKFQKKGPTSRNIADLEEKGSGKLSIQMEVW